MRDAAISISANIAEGFGRWHRKDKINFYFYSRGSACEERSHLLSGKRVGYFTDEEVSPISNKCKQVVEELNKLIKSLNPKPKPKPQPQPQSQPQPKS